VSHPFLDRLPRARQAEEIVESKRTLEAITGKPVRYFAYPNGDYDRNTLAAVREAGFDAAFAVRSKRLEADGRFEIERVGIYSTSHVKFWLKATGVVALAHRVRSARAVSAFGLRARQLRSRVLGREP
jgi:peptidoglycan/xylan/chitin deacetylase (PgdA/CDA1 family)